MGRKLQCEVVGQKRRELGPERQNIHKALVSACDSRWLQWMRQLMFDQHERYRRLSRMKTVMTRDIHEEHKALFEAAIDRDAAKAVAVIGVHVQRTTDAVLTVLADGGR